MMTSITWARFNSRQVYSKHATSQSTISTTTPMPDGLMQEEIEADCLKEVETFFRSFGVTLPKEKAFRYACFHGFDAEKTIEQLCMDTYYPYLQLKMGYLEEQFQSNTLFPIPYLRARNNTEVIYMRPSPFFSSVPKKCDKFVQSLCYVLNDLSQTKEQCRNGVTVIADMQNINKEKFNKEQFKNLIYALEGEMVPTRVGALIFVTSPLWFGNKIWKWMKRTMTKDFAKRVHLIHAERLPEFLMGDFKMFLPDEFCQGLARGSEISEDYIDLKMMQERRIETQ